MIYKVFAIERPSWEVFNIYCPSQPFKCLIDCYPPIYILRTLQVWPLIWTQNVNVRESPTFTLQECWSHSCTVRAAGKARPERPHWFHHHWENAKELGPLLGLVGCSQPLLKVWTTNARIVDLLAGYSNDFTAYMNHTFSLYGQPYWSWSVWQRNIQVRVVLKSNS